MRQVMDPQLKRDIVTLNMVRSIDLSGQTATVGLKLPQRASGFREQIREQATEAVRQLGLEPNIQISIDLSGGDPQPAAGQTADDATPLPDVKRIIAVGAGKGGVGKSTIAVNLAVGLARTGSKVGLLDGDIYGPSLPTMIGSDRYEPRTVGNMLIPFELHGIKSMTLGALVEDDKPLIWRGPMAHGAFKQLVTQTDWGKLDEMIIDLPPGTGDVPLTMSQLLPLTGAIVVCTPQKVAQDDAKRAIAMFRQLGVEVLGLVENMSYFIGDDGKEYDLFGRGGAEMLAHQAGVPFLGAVPINTDLRRNADAGDPTANYTGNDQLAKELDAVVSAVRRELTAHEADPERLGPTLTVR